MPRVRPYIATGLTGLVAKTSRTLPYEGGASIDTIVRLALPPNPPLPNPSAVWHLRISQAPMKFGKSCEEACEELYRSTKVPAFPYRALKKHLKRVQ